MLSVTPHQGNTNQNHTQGITSRQSEWPKWTNQEAIDAGDDVEKQELSCTVGGNANWCNRSGKQWRSPPPKLKIELPYDPAIALLDIYPRDTCVLLWRDTCTPMFITALSTIAKLCIKPKCPSTDEWIKKSWFIYTMEYYVAMIKNEIWPFVATWMELESVMLSEISHTEKDRCRMFLLLCGSWET